MTVAPIEANGEEGGVAVEGSAVEGEAEGVKQREALMILGLDRAVDDVVRKSLIGKEGMLEVSVVVL